MQQIYRRTPMPKYDFNKVANSPFESGKGKERKKLQKFEYIENEKSF